MDRLRIPEHLRQRASARRDHVRVVRPLRMYLETGRTWTFAVAVDWPGWCRRGKGPEAAVEALASYRERYEEAIGVAIPAARLTEIGRVPGRSGTDFGIPSSLGPSDDEPVSTAERSRLLGILGAGWSRLDVVAGTAPAELRKGPRGGGRDRDKIVGHVCEAERAYGPSMGVRLPSSQPWPDQRQSILDHLAAYPPDTRWPLRYAVRRLSWHILDHVWEIEDRS